MKIIRMLQLKLDLQKTLLLVFLLAGACVQADTSSEMETVTPTETVPGSEEPTANPESPDTSPTITTAFENNPAIVPETSEDKEPATTITVEKEASTQETVTPEVVIETQEEIPTDIDTEPTLQEASNTEPETVEEIPDPAPQTAPSHQIWDDLLSRYVSSSGQVDYPALKANKAELQSYLDILADNPPRNDWSRNERMAYWINAYNAFTVKMIVDNYPVNSIKDIYGGNPWDVKWIELGNQTYSLNQIENEILRPIFQDARIHFAVNCAATSCPPLYNRAFTAAQLNSQLEQQTNKFINNPTYNMLKADRVEVSKIFDWYSSDFGNLISYLNDYSRTEIETNADISFMNYDWRLNGK